MAVCTHAVMHDHPAHDQHTPEQILVLTIFEAYLVVFDRHGHDAFSVFRHGIDSPRIKHMNVSFSGMEMVGALKVSMS